MGSSWGFDKEPFSESFNNALFCLRNCENGSVLRTLGSYGFTRVLGDDRKLSWWYCLLDISNAICQLG